MQLLRRWASNLGLWPRVALAISLGFVVLSAAFLALGERALSDSTDRLLEERLVIAQMLAGEIDGLLVRAVSELEQAQHIANLDPGNADVAATADLLTRTYSRVGDFATGVVFLDPEGRVISSHPPGLGPPAAGVSGFVYVHLPAVQSGVTISDPFRDPLSRRPVAAVTVPIRSGDRIEELADWNETLETRVAERTEELRRQQALTRQLLRRVITAQEEERARLARELHGRSPRAPPDRRWKTSSKTWLRVSLVKSGNSWSDCSGRHDHAPG